MKKKSKIKNLVITKTALHILPFAILVGASGTVTANYAKTVQQLTQQIEDQKETNRKNKKQLESELLNADEEKRAYQQQLEAHKQQLEETKRIKTVRGHDLLCYGIEYLDEKEEIMLEGTDILHSSDETFNLMMDKMEEMQHLHTISITGFDILSSELNESLSDERRNRIIEVLSSKKEVESLELQDLGLTSLEFLKNYTHLQNLDLSVNDISDITALQNLTSLTSLELDFNPNIQDYSVLETLENLEKLSLCDNHITDIKAIGSFENVTSLRLSFNPIENLEGIEQFKNIKKLSLDFTNISAISGLMRIPNLKELSLESCHLSSVDGITDCPHLEVLFLGNNQITDITPLKNLTSLRGLYLDDNAIEDITILSSLIHLENLDLSSNQIKDIDSLKELTKLRYVRLQENQIENVDALRDLQSITYLALKDNQITNIDALLGHEGRYHEATLSGNPIDDESVVKFLVENEEVSIFSCLSYHSALAYASEIEIKRSGPIEVLGTKELLAYDVKWLLENEEVSLGEELFDLEQSQYDLLLQKLKSLPNLKRLKIVGPPYYRGVYHNKATLETKENIEKLIETLMMIENLESLDMTYIYGLDNANFVYDLPDLTDIHLEHNSIPEEQVNAIYQFINNHQKQYQKKESFE